MDGNRRWAKKNNFFVWLGHEHGIKPLHTLTEFCIDYSIKHLTIYALSIENLGRSKIELKHLFNIFFKEIEIALPKFMENNIKVRFLGDFQLLSIKMREVINSTIIKTEQNTGLLLDVLFCYGGQQEIINATKQIGLDVQKGLLDPAIIDKQLFESYLWTGTEPGPCFVIRTGGAQRLSNFSLYKIAYSELLFIEKLWPDLCYEDLVNSVIIYNARIKNLGK